MAIWFFGFLVFFCLVFLPSCSPEPSGMLCGKSGHHIRRLGQRLLAEIWMRQRLLSKKKKKM